MPSTNANSAIYATRASRYPAINIASGTAINTITPIFTADATYGSIVTDVLVRALGAATNFDIIICPTGAQATAENARVQISVPANSGNNGSTILFSLSAVVPALFDLDLAGNRVIMLEAGWSMYMKNIAATPAAFYVTVKAKDYAP